MTISLADHFGVPSDRNKFVGLVGAMKRDVGARNALADAQRGGVDQNLIAKFCRAEVRHIDFERDAWLERLDAADRNRANNVDKRRLRSTVQALSANLASFCETTQSIKVNIQVFAHVITVGQAFVDLEPRTNFASMNVIKTQSSRTNLIKACSIS